MTSTNVVTYLRRSTDKQEASIPDQRAAIQEYAAKQGYKIVREYVDDGISGDDTKKRKSFQQMIADADQGDFKAIVCWDQDRFGRFDMLEAGRWICPLRDAGVTLVTMNDGPIDWENFQGRMMYGIKQEGKHQFLRDLGRNVARGQLEAAKAGSWLGSSPYAYRIEGPRKAKRLVLDDPAKARVVKRIFKEYVEEGRSMTNIANRLQDEGITSPGGVKPWCCDSVRVILENRAYVGDVVSCRWSYGKYATIKAGAVAKAASKCRTRKPEEEWFVHPDKHEAIIDRVTFAKAGQILAKGKTGRSHRYSFDDNPFLLTGLLVCGKCGGPLWGMRGGSGKSEDRPRYYECSKAKHDKKYRVPAKDACPGTTVREDRLLHYIADYLDDEFLSLDGKDLVGKANRKELKPGDLPKAFGKVRRLIAPPKAAVADRKRMDKQAKELAGQVAKAKANLVHLDAEFIPAAQQEIRKQQAELDALDAELKKQPPSEDDINAETLAVLRGLTWLGLYFRLATSAQEGEDADLRKARLAFKGADVTAEVRKALRHVAEIRVHTAKDGAGNGVRHAFLRGEIGFSVVGSTAGSQNPHQSG